ncbi:SIR2 family protein [Ralstonia solanacearum]|nr:Sir2-family regulator [Ralstonia pseudosolanacearum]AVV67734.1 SIR2 family protein [Ralstonia solanacearum OE1-1]OIN72053.1 SIR2 family protein [Ralstonia solanacearum]TXE01731.1 SIR2 family protein [Ralstonia pseudosolanacearum]
MQSSLPVISASEFASFFALRPHLFAWFLGAGASASSGIPTGYAMIRDFKTRIFCREVGYASKEVDAADPLWISRIDDFFRTNAILPPDGDPTEYSAAFEAVFPQERHRRQYIDDAVRLGTPSFAHRVLACLMSSGKLNCVFTTNFDSLIETSTTLTDQLLPPNQRAMPTLAALDSADRASRCVAESDWPLIAKLHGDYTSTQIKNTNSELEHQDERMRAVLVEACKRFGLVVVGYSGRDTSVMEALESLLRHSNAYPSGLYWVCSSKSKLLPAVTQFLENAVLAGVDVNVVESKNFDELAGDLIKQVDLPDVLLEHVMQRKAPPRLQPVKPQTTDARLFPVLRYSALLVESVPTTARRILLSKAANTSDVRALLRAQGCRAVVSCQGRLLAAFGNDAQLLAALQPFDAKLDGTIALDPENDSWALGLIYDALTRALARRRPLAPRFKRAGHGLVVIRTRPDEDAALASRRESELGPLKAAYESSLTGMVPNLSLPYREGVRVKLERIEQRWWCNFEPFTFVDVPLEKNSQVANGENSDALGMPLLRGGDPAGDWRRERWARKYNSHWSQIIDAWATLLTGAEDGRVSALGLSGDEGIDASFRLSPVTGWSRPSHHHDYFERTK